ncbi:septal ring lytic transglycosylase RlpA family protein [Dissulfurirhabdus thermomarina]|uniref:Probable endolytic peptidoglycan transglycosylase RlpA n=1 Tax=Dissulfurirhabdus thermomarina TaxID=1765737 RepID=A0A6N9TPR7_DISTH|nr:septal ring lytic transglycosylase RlpA family protein [Dissulfurirhabdus thermomarina]NDY42093.1 septal ring lytic transglycosylase RlpA family protein [Dissulfurirhabdus thermomarina]NMX22495.1 septal ring lytic transglycosylase RlpA family protein [Dissulfurirhabdus thermomarina]
MARQVVFFFAATVLAAGPAGCGYTRPGAGAAVEVLPGGDTGTQRPYRAFGKVYRPLASARGYRAEGVASWYGPDFHGRRTANGETYDMHALTAAHRTLPMGTRVRVVNLDNGRSVVVRINDRGPFVRGRIIDLSYAAARKLGMIGPGTARVRIEALAPAGPAPGRGGVTTAGGGPKAPPVSTPSPAAGPGRVFYVQVATFQDRAKARKLQAELAATFRGVEVVALRRDGATFYRVQVLAATTLEGAKQFESQLARMGYEAAFVVRR